MRTIPLVLLIALLAPAADYQVEGNVRYGSHPEAVLDLLQPRAPALEKRPAVVLIRDSGWWQTDKQSLVDQVAAPFIQRDFVVALVEYGRPEDVSEAIEWVRERADRYKIDPRRLVIVAASSGGRLALAVAASAKGVAAVIDFFGILERSDPLLSQKGLPPLLAIHAAGDAPKTAAMIQTLKAGGNNADMIATPGDSHGIAAAAMEKLWPQVFKWLKKRKITS
jgi:acetyl esterase/lipase